MMTNKKADLAGPGISTYKEVEKVLPKNYKSLLTPKETQKAIFAAKYYIEEHLGKELNLMMVTVPLIVDKESGVNDYLDRDGSRTPVEFPCGLGLQKRIQAQVVQAATKWKRMALKEFDMNVGEGLNTDMRAVRKDYFLDHDHSSYVDQWDWEKVITKDQRNLQYLKDTVNKIWKVIKGAENLVYLINSHNSNLRRFRISQTNLNSSMLKKSWICTLICLGSSGKPLSFRITLRSSLLVLARC